LAPHTLFATEPRFMPKIALPLLACLLAIAATGASAQSIWKWRDSSGQIHISDTPPPANVQAKDILQRGAGPAPAAAAAPVAALAGASGSAPAGDSDLQKKKAKADQEKTDKAAADKAALEQKNAAIRADNCQRAQAQAKALDSGIRITRMNAKGEREYLDDNARAAEQKRSQDIITQNCGAAPSSTAP
jgi:hypothetical protein